VAWGGSAGGHLVALLGTTGGAAELDGHVNDLKESSRVQAVVDWFGPTDFLQIGNAESDLQHNAPDSPESKLIGGPVLENKDKAARPVPSATSARTRRRFSSCTVTATGLCPSTRASYFIRR